MDEDRRTESSIPRRASDEPDAISRRSRGSLIIFVLVAIALILAIGFFYITKDRNDRRADAPTQAGESADSAAYVVGDAAKNAADALRNHD
ncbi:hypothetical protein [Sphingobium sp.]|uniref:hypothetical protein n=1 Tax=Sphingobium sp. TaxID=1912891 RepID=UPI0028BD2C90|nr:hypothetical protein [Sphingobium sp.]